jgi:glycosyltransferase involved in cell wall biosynthesis
MDRRVAREALCAAHGIAPDCAILVSVGRLEARKGIDWFIREVLPLVEDEVVFLVAGSGPREPAIRQASEALARRGQVRFLGRVTEHEKNVLMSGADVFVMPNISVPGDMEGFGLVAIEAAMRGTPVLGADLEGIRDSVIPSKTGWLVEAQDPEVFAEVVRFVAQNRAEMEQRRISIRNYAAAHFSLDAMRQSLLESLGIQDGSADTTGDDDPR